MLVRQPVDEVRLQCFHAGVQLGQQRPHAPRGIRCGLGDGLGCGVLSGTVVGELGQVRVAAPLLEADMPLAPGHGLRIEQTRDREELGQDADGRRRPGCRPEHASAAPWSRLAVRGAVRGCSVERP